MNDAIGGLEPELIRTDFSLNKPLNKEINDSLLISGLVPLVHSGGEMLTHTLMEITLVLNHLEKKFKLQLLRLL